MVYPTEYIVAHHGHPVWEAIWQTLRGWDIEREPDQGRSNATGDDVQRIYDAVSAVVRFEKMPEAEKP